MKRVLLLTVGLLILVSSANANMYTTIFNLSEDTADEYMGELTDADFSIIRNDVGDTTGDGSSATAYINLLSTSTAQQYSSLHRLGYGFNTSTIPDNASITNTIFRFVVKTKTNYLGNQSIGITNFSPVTANNFIAGDFDSFGNYTYTDNYIDNENITTEVYTNVTFNATGRSAINKTGYTNFMMRLQADIVNSNSTITWTGATASGYAIYDYNETVSKQPQLEITYSIPVASITHNVTGGTYPTTVQLNDTSTDNITAWNWTWTRIDVPSGLAFSTDQNVSFESPSEGVYDITLTVTDSNGGVNTSTAHRLTFSDSDGLSGWNRQDVVLEKIYTFTLNVKDYTTHDGIPGANIITNNGNNLTTDLFGSATMTTNYTLLYVTVGASGYGSRSSSYIADRDRNETLYLFKLPNTTDNPYRGTNPLYPQQIQFILVDKYGHALTGVAVTATMTSMSINGTNWLTELFQISANATPIDTTVLTDTSEDAGTVVFPMIASGTYLLTFDKPADGIHETKSIHPTQPYYIFILSTTGSATVANLRDSVNASLGVYPPASTNPTTVYLQGNYTDTLNQTTNVTFYVLYPNQTVLYSNSTSVNTTSRNVQYAVNNTAGSGYVWGISALRGSTYVNKSTGITMKGNGQSGLANNLVRVGCNNWGCT